MRMQVLLVCLLLTGCPQSEPVPTASPTTTATTTTANSQASATPMSRQVQEIQALDYYWRFSREDFLASSDPQISPKLKQPVLSLLPSLSPLEILMPAAYAEVPPEHQQLFSLHLTFDHQARTMQAQWRYQMRTQPATAEFGQKSYDSAAYGQLIQDLSAEPLTCTSKQSSMTVGAAPQQLAMMTAAGRKVVTATGDLGQGDYLCHQDLLAELRALRSELSKQDWNEQ